jgi:hypothetical protein
MVLDLGGAHGRVKRYRNRTGIQNCVKRGEEIRAGRQHQRHAAARLDLALEIAGKLPRSCRELSVSQDRLAASVLGKEDMRPIAIETRVRIEDLGQGRGVVRQGDRLGTREGCRFARRFPSGRRCTGNCRDQLAQRFRVAKPPLPDVDAKAPLDPSEKLHPGEAIEAPVTLETAIEA